jgi:hypothetical protein
MQIRVGFLSNIADCILKSIMSGTKVGCKEKMDAIFRVPLLTINHEREREILAVFHAFLSVL